MVPELAGCQPGKDADRVVQVLFASIPDHRGDGFDFQTCLHEQLNRVSYPYAREIVVHRHAKCSLERSHYLPTSLTYLFRKSKDRQPFSVMELDQFFDTACEAAAW